MVAHGCNPASRSMRQEDHEFMASLGYIARLCLKKKEWKEILTHSATWMDLKEVIPSEVLQTQKNKIA
jgi:hypothetical protein